MSNTQTDYSAGDRLLDHEALQERWYAEDPGMKVRVEARVAEYEVAMQLRKMRLAAGLTQKELAARLETTNSVISRLESATYRGHTVALLYRFADACGQRLELRFTPIQGEAAVETAVETEAQEAA